MSWIVGEHLVAPKKKGPKVEVKEEEKETRAQSSARIE
jgi:hypothetical protein